MFRSGVSSYDGDQRRSRTPPGGRSRRLRCCPGQSGCRGLRGPGWDAGRALRVGWGALLFKPHRHVGPSPTPAPGLPEGHGSQGAHLIGPHLAGRRRAGFSHEPPPWARNPSEYTHTCPQCRRGWGALKSPGVLRIKTRNKQHLRKEHVGRETRVEQTNPHVRPPSTWTPAEEALAGQGQLQTHGAPCPQGSWASAHSHQPGQGWGGTNQGLHPPGRMTRGSPEGHRHRGMAGWGRVEGVHLSYEVGASQLTAIHGI